MIAVNRRVPKNCLESVKITATGTGSDVQMTEVRKSLVCTAALVFALAPHSTFSQDAGSANGVQHFGIAAKRPVFAGACKACPWGILASVTAQALRYYGYDTQICWVCWSNFGPREMADKTKPTMPPGAEANDPLYIEPPPDAVPDISATSESNLIDAWNGTGPYARDNKQRRNYRIIAVVRTTTYMLAAASKKSGITNLRQIKDRMQATWIVGGNDIIFDYYDIKPADLRAKGGGVIPALGPSDKASRDRRAMAEVFIGTGLLANTPEQRSWYEATQVNDLIFLEMDEPLLDRLARQPGYERATIPLALFRGVDRPIPTVMRPNHVIYVRDDAPDEFAYTAAKALDEHRLLFQVQLEPWYYDPQTVTDSKTVPLHPGALKYYRERGWVK
jgi:TRAP-type uncharacterized transport system substrate-binding protein